MRKRIRFMLFAMVMMLFAGSITVNAASFALTKTKATVNLGETVDIDILGSTEKPVWTSWNVNKVSVDENGVVTALRTGKTTVSARIGITRKKCTITVVNPTIKLNKTASTIYTGGSSTKYVKLTPTIKGSSKKVAWVSSNPEVAVVDETGRVTSVSPGKTVISATANNKTTNCNVTVKETSLKLDNSDIQLSTKGNGSAITLKPTIVGSKKTVTWSSSNKKVATVDTNGKVTGKKTGTAVITAKVNGVTATCNVNVIGGSISFSKENTLLYTGETEQLKTNAAKKAVVAYTSSNPAVVTVDEKGKIIAVAEGNAVITAESNETKDTCVVTVKNSTTTVKENGIVLKTKGSKTYQLKASVVGRGKTVKWASADSTIASVDKNGKVTARKAGTTTITATANKVTDSIQVIVEDYDATIKLNYKNYILYTKKGNTLTLKPTVVGASKTVKWESSNPAVAKVSTKGKVTALKEGQAVIKATANGVSAECVIDVKNSQVVLETKHMWLEKGQKGYLPADFIGSSQTYTYKSSNTKIATVSKSGLVTAKKYGTAKIKVTANGVSATCVVYVDKCVHNFNEGEITKAPTCKDLGVKKITCTKCGYFYEAEVETVDHTWVETERLAPNCINRGRVISECSVCFEEKRDILEIVDHTYGEWITLIPATEECDGLERQYCEFCNHKNERSVIYNPIHTHIYESVVTAPTCTEQGYTTYSCSCGDSYTDDYVDALGHAWGEWEVTTEATEVAEGVETRVCGNCGEEETNTIPQLDHTHEYSNEVVTAPTCTEMGYTTYSCRCEDSYIDNYVDALGHDWKSWEVTTEATEESEGEETRSCNRCEKTETREIPKKNHVHAYDTTEVTIPTCAEEGYTTYICKCGDSYKADYVDKVPHDWNEWEVTTEPTEEEVGEEVRGCKNCTETESREIPKKNHVHSYDTTVVDATCVDKGYTLYECKCGDTHKDNYVDALGHNWSVWEVVNDSTEEEEGLKRRVCSVCTLEDKVSIPVKDHTHSYNEEVTAPSCTTQGYTTYTCKCGENYKNKYVDALGHNWGAWEVTEEATEEKAGSKVRGCTRCEEEETQVIPQKTHEHEYNTEVTDATCTTEGYTTYTCDCGASYTDDHVSALGHNWGAWEVTKAATEEETGIETSICSRCEEEKTQVIPKKEHVHNYSSVVTEPTCIEQGYTTYTCKCGYSYKDNYVDATGHDYEETVVDANCTEKGFTTYTCHCGYTYNGKYVNALGHNYEHIVTAPTCVAEGYTTHTCKNCNDAYSDARVSATGHTYGNYVVNKVATCTEDGERDKTCTVCSHVETEVLEKLGHNFNTSYTVDVPATCTEDGIKSLHCNRCTAKKDVTYIPAAGHSYSEFTITKAPTCISDGLKERICSVCEDKDTTVISKLGHDFASGYTVDIQATCTTDGSKSQHCSRCDVKNDVTVIPALGHTEVTDSAVEATCTESGLTEGKHCEVCNEVLVKQNTVPAKGHSYIGGKCSSCDDEIIDDTVSIGNLRDGGTYAIGTSVTVPEGGTLTVNGEVVTETEYIFGKEGTYEVVLTDNESVTKTVTITINNDAKTSVADLVNGQEYAQGTTVSIPSGSTASVNGEEVTGDSYTFTEEGTYEIVITDKDGNRTITNITVAHNHVYTERVALEATCTQDGTKEFKCSCNDTYTEVIPAPGHNEVEDKAVAVTCTTSGLTAGKHCSVCNEILVAQNTIPATGHNIVDNKCTNCEYEIIDNTATVGGLKDGGSYKPGASIQIPEGGSLTVNGELITEEDGEFVFSEEGTYEVVLTDKDGKTTTATIIIDNDSNTLVSDLTNNGIYPENTELTLPSNGSSVTVNGTEVTGTTYVFTEEGTYEIVVIDKDGNKFITTVTIAHKHIFSSEVTKAASCEEAGQLLYTCKCGESYTEAISPLGHNYSATYTVDADATCTEDGSKAQHCSRCTSKKNVTVIPALGHSYGEVSYVWNEELTECTASRICTRDTSHVDTEMVSSVYSVTDEPTCTENGAGLYTADFANEEFVTQTRTVVVDYLGHEFSEEYTVDVPETCTEEGSKSQHCSRCEETQNVTVIPAAGHSEEFGGVAGIHTQCSVCKVLLSTEHNYEKTTAVAPTCTKNGTSKYACECGYFYTADDIEKIPHNYVNGICVNDGCNAQNIHISSEEPGVYDIDGYMVASWDELATTYAVDTADSDSLREVLDANEELGDVTQIVFGSDMQSIKNGSFQNCDALTYVATGYGVTYIEPYAFENCDSLETLNLSDRVEFINEFAFANCDSLKSVVGGDSLQSIGISTFGGCVLLTEVELGGTNEIPERAFQGCTSLTDFDFDYVQTIGKNAFNGCTAMESITIGQSTRVIGNGAFSECTSLREVFISESGNLESIGQRAFSGCTLIDPLTIPDSVTTIGLNAFFSIPHVYYSGTAEGAPWGAVALNKCNENCQHEITLECGMPGGYDADGNLVISWDRMVDEYDIDIVNPYTYSLSNALSNAQYDTNDLTNVTQLIVGMPESGTIGMAAFTGCTQLTYIELPEGISEIPASAFERCQALKTVVIPDGVTIIGGYAFSVCPSLENINIPNSVTTIEYSAFENCPTLKTITVPSSVTTIGSDAFSGMENVNYNGTATGAPWGALSVNGVYYIASGVAGAYDANGRMVADWEELLTDYGLNVESNYMQDTLLEAEGIESTSGIGADGNPILSHYRQNPHSPYRVFSDNPELSTVTQLIVGDINTDSVTTSAEGTTLGGTAEAAELGYCVFAGTSFTYVKLPDGITKVPQYAFNLAKSLERVDIPDGVTIVGQNSFYQCSALTEIEFPSSVKTIAKKAFQGCTALTEVVIPKTVTAMKDECFRGCTNLKTVYFQHTSAPTWGDNCFYKASGKKTTFNFTKQTIMDKFTTTYYNSTYGTKALGTIIS